MEITPPIPKKCIICNECCYENTLIKCSNACLTLNQPPYYIHFHCSFFFPCLSIGLSREMSQSCAIIKNFRIKGIRDLLMIGKSSKCEKCENTEPAFMTKCFYE